MEAEPVAETIAVEPVVEPVPTEDEPVVEVAPVVEATPAEETPVVEAAPAAASVEVARSKAPSANRRRTCTCSRAAAGAGESRAGRVYKHIATAPMTKAPAPAYVPEERKHSNWQRPSFNFEGKGSAGGHSAVI